MHSTGYYAGLARAQLAKLNETAEKALPPVIASRDPQNRDDSGSTPRAPPQKDHQAKLAPKPSEDFREAAPDPAAPAIAVDLCKQEQEKLARLRANPARDEIIRLERNLTCERLRLQVVRLRESVVGELPGRPARPQSRPRCRSKTTTGVARRRAMRSKAPRSRNRTRESGGASLLRSLPARPGNVVRLRASPVRQDVLRFERELACERLRPQVLRLRESLGSD